MKKLLVTLLTGGALLITATSALAQDARPMPDPYGDGTVRSGMTGPMVEISSVRPPYVKYPRHPNVV
ncbi:hypothetical protein FXF51_01950 [Nonomuraea sp. PA05]|uniref:hypothetical protein n=1 Tax=Nonomuraea sp. PA05 TaxID=2604466 RepID=UPI0011D8C2AA|nr:hypothetical protein [Nonomuraea sp. PA05]TYB71224.1 hypothetical protein FXF51_01950 [Nonomuraea sp. PA05]